MIEQAVIDAENARVTELERVAKLKVREESARPDKEKLRAFEVKIMELAKLAPTVEDVEAREALRQSLLCLINAREHLQDYAGVATQSQGAE